MSNAGTRRTTILNRRSAQKARMAYWGKRVSLVLVVLVLVAGWVSYASTSGYFDQIGGRMARAFHAKMVDYNFKVHNVTLAGRVHANRDALKRILDIEQGQSIFEPDLADMKSKIQNVTWVKDVTVERRLPDTIAVTIVERQPIALWQNKGTLSVIDEDGLVLRDEKLERFKNLLILVGDDAPSHAGDLVAMISVEKDVRDRVDSAKWIGGRRWDLYLKNGVAVRLPEEDMGQAVRRLATAQGEAKLMDKNIESIDLRDPVRIVVQTKTGAANEYQAAYHPQKDI